MLYSAIAPPIVLLRPSARLAGALGFVAMDGGCACGFVRYRADGAPFHETLCHCSICRRTTGAPAVAWFSVRLSDFRFLLGSPQGHRSSEHGTRSFCPRCGTQLTFQSSHFPDEIDVTTCSLDEPERVPPKDLTYASSKLSWAERAAELPAFPRARP
jgi:hypothetical protein